MPEPHRQQRTVRVIAVTGSIGAGKSTFCRLISELGLVARLDADQCVHELLAGPGRVRDAVAARFGAGVARPDGAIDRAALAAIVFSDPSALRDLETILHPAVRDMLARRVADLKRARQVAIVLVEIPLLAEKGAPSFVDEVVTVEAEETLRRDRLMDKGLDGVQIERRIANQVDREARERVAQHVVINDGGVAALAAEARRLWKRWRAAASGKE
jgi:dephospho-CoA kinase